MLPSSKLDGRSPEPLSVYYKSFMMIAATIFHNVAQLQTKLQSYKVAGDQKTLSHHTEGKTLK